MTCSKPTRTPVFSCYSEDGSSDMDKSVDLKLFQTDWLWGTKRLCCSMTARRQRVRTNSVRRRFDNLRTTSTNSTAGILRTWVICTASYRSHLHFRMLQLYAIVQTSYTASAGFL
jgi:hypothetical protein